MGKAKVTNNINITGGMVSFSVSYKVEYRVKGASTWIDAGTTTVDGNTQSNFKRIFRIPGLSPNRYEIRITRVSANPTSTQKGDINLTSVDEIRNQNIAYVNSALLAVHMLANNQISGEIPNVSCIGTGKKVKVG